jgi:hypothetical protein
MELLMIERLKPLKEVPFFDLISIVRFQPLVSLKHYQIKQRLTMLDKATLIIKLLTFSVIFFKKRFIHKCFYG